MQITAADVSKSRYCDDGSWIDPPTVNAEYNVEAIGGGCTAVSRSCIESRQSPLRSRVPHALHFPNSTGELSAACLTTLMSSSGTSAHAGHSGADGITLGQRLAVDSRPTYAILKRPWGWMPAGGWSMSWSGSAAKREPLDG